MEKWQYDIRVIRNLLFITFFILILFILYSLANIFIPFAFAFFLALFLQPVVAWFRSKNISLGLSVVIISICFLSVLALVDVIIYDTAKGLITQKEMFIDRINTGLVSLTNSVNSMTSYDLNVSEIKESLRELLTNNWLLERTGNFAGKIGSFSGKLFLTILYFMGMLGGISQYEKYFQYLRENKEEKQNQMVDAFRKIQGAIGTYIKVKTFVSFLTGLGYAITCLAFGVDFFLLWGFLAFSLNFIPVVGSLVATLPPVVMAFMYFDNYGALLIFILILIAIQVVMGSILEPMLMGARLSLNLVTVILGVVFWGTLWGTAGMILSVPMMVLLKIILEQIPDASIIVKLMEAKIKKPEEVTVKS